MCATLHMHKKSIGAFAVSVLNLVNTSSALKCANLQPLAHALLAACVVRGVCVCKIMSMRYERAGINPRDEMIKHVL